MQKVTGTVVFAPIHVFFCCGLLDPCLHPLLRPERCMRTFARGGRIFEDNGGLPSLQQQGIEDRWVGVCILPTISTGCILQDVISPSAFLQCVEQPEGCTSPREPKIAICLDLLRLFSKYLHRQASLSRRRLDNMTHLWSISNIMRTMA